MFRASAVKCRPRIESTCCGQPLFAGRTNGRTHTFLQKIFHSSHCSSFEDSSLSHSHVAFMHVAYLSQSSLLFLLFLSISSPLPLLFLFSPAFRPGACRSWRIFPLHQDGGSTSWSGFDGLAGFGDLWHTGDQHHGVEPALLVGHVWVARLGGRRDSRYICMVPHPWDEQQIMALVLLSLFTHVGACSCGPSQGLAWQIARF